MDEVDEVEDLDTAADQAPHVSLGFPTPSGWRYHHDPEGTAMGHADVGEPSDMRKVKAPVDPDPIDLTRQDVPLVTEVTVVQGTE